VARTSRERERSPEPDDRLAVPHIRLSDADRLEMLSDGVFAITITLLVLGIVRPDHSAGHLLRSLWHQWPNYIAFPASFLYIGIIRLNHRAVSSRVRECTRSLHPANLLLLLTAGLIPVPTAVLSTALPHGSPPDATVAAELYAAIDCLTCLSRLLLFHILSLNPHLLETHVERVFFPRDRQRREAAHQSESPAPE
jgi:uncharacterized membrane protein